MFFPLIVGTRLTRCPGPILFQKDNRIPNTEHASPQPVRACINGIDLERSVLVYL